MKTLHFRFSSQISNYSAQNGSESRFCDRCFFFRCVELWKMLWSVLLHHWRLHFLIRFQFQVIRKGCEGSGDDS